MAFNIANVLGAIQGVANTAASVGSAYQQVRSAFGGPQTLTMPTSGGFVQPARQPAPRVLTPYTGDVFPAVMPPVRSVMPISNAPPEYNRLGGELVSGSFGGRFVNLAGRALQLFQAAQAAPVHPAFDVLTMGQYDDEELAKVVASKGAIPAQSDLGQLAISRGAKTRKVRIRFSDGSSTMIDVVPFATTGGKRRRLKNLTPHRIRSAAWVMRRLHAQQKLGKRLAATAQKLYPRRSSAPKASKRRR